MTQPAEARVDSFAEPPAPASFVDVLLRQARRNEARAVYTFLATGDVDGTVDELTFGALVQRATAIAAQLQASGVTGRALLLYPPGPDYVAAFLGALCAGVTAVPAYPPDPLRLDRTLPRLVGIARDCDASVVLTTGAIDELAGEFLAAAPELAQLPRLATDGIPLSLAERWVPPALSRDDLAFLQYTSGSTGSPRGVMVTHGNLLHNSAAIHAMAGFTPESVYVCWLPNYHDMGLIGGLLQPLFGGFHGVLMSPMAFLERPLRWLQAITKYGGTVSPFPNFALDLCVRKVTAEEKRSLRLQSWVLACNGAEPVRQQSLDRFTEAFQECGFRAQAHYPAYGLAEATLIVTGGHLGEASHVMTVDREALTRNEVRVIDAAVAPGASQTTIVGCGNGLPDQQVRIVDPEARVPCAAGRVGEVWVRGPSVAAGYWNRPEETAFSFGATLANAPDETFLRTGDLGFMADGELYVTGRLKDVIIIRGQNHYPQDIEATVERVDRRVRKGCCAAFSFDSGGVEQLGIVAEVSPGTGELDQLVKAIRDSVGAEHGLAAARILLLEPGSIPKTSSGKIQRSATRDAMLAGTLAPVGEWPGAAAPQAAQPRTADVAPTSALEDELANKLAALLARHLGLPVEEIDQNADVRDYGLDSLMAVEIASSVESTLQRRLKVDDLWGSPSIRDLASRLAKDRRR